MTTEARPDQAQALWFIDDLARIHVDAESSDGRLVLIEQRARRGDMPPLHVHHRDDETFFLLDGELSLFIAAERLSLRSGQAAFAPREVPHTYRVESEEARWLVITAPAGFDAFVRAVAEPAPVEELPPPGRPLDQTALARAAAEAGIEILGPPGTLPGA